MEKSMQYGFTALVLLVTSIGMYLAKNWNSTTGLFPRAVGFPLIVLVIIILAIDLKHDLSHKEKNKAAKKDDDFAATNLCMLRHFVWLFGFALFAWGIGITYTIPIFIFSHMKMEGKYGWLICSISAIVTTAFIHILFVQVFRVGWPKGVLFDLLS